MSLKCQNSQAEVGLQCGEQWEEVGETGWGVFAPGRQRSSEPEPIGINSRVVKVFQRGGRVRQAARLQVGWRCWVEAKEGAWSGPQCLHTWKWWPGSHQVNTTYLSPPSGRLSHLSLSGHDFIPTLLGSPGSTSLVKPDPTCPIPASLEIHSNSAVSLDILSEN